MKQRWLPFHYQIPLTEGEIPMDKGGFRAVTAKGESKMSALEAVVYCKDCKKRNQHHECEYGYHSDDWFCADGERE